MSEMVGHAIAIRSIGCRTNQEEMVVLSGKLASQGYSIVDDLSSAAIIIVNTCSVTGTTESKTKRLLHAISAEAPQARILVTGCLAQQLPDELIRFRGVSWVVGNNEKERIDYILNHSHGGIWHTPANSADRDKPLGVSFCALPPVSVERAPLRTRFPVKIQEGCDSRCSYCIVPMLRGPSRSAQLNDIVDTCSRAIGAGYKEIVLTGTHIGRFADSEGNRLPALIDMIAAIEGDFRIRLSSLDPVDCRDELLERVAHSDKLCRHLHVSLQSCCAEVLVAMNRPQRETIDCIERLISFRNSNSSAGIGADIIAGFPGETDAMFEETCRQVERIGLSYAHVFRFSPRPGTNAALFDDPVAESVKRERSGRLRKIVESARERFLKRLEGTVQRIIVESGPPLRGTTSNYIHVEIDESVLQRNTWLDVTLSGKLGGRYCSAQPVLSKVA